MSDLSIYIHYPFCKSKCPYCDFNSHVGNGIGDDNLLMAYQKELQYFKNLIGNKKVKTIYFGGGTPSLMSEKLLDGILQKISDEFYILNSVEITMEANPTSFEVGKFKAFKNIGLNRLSLGIQSLNDADLKFLGREHNSKDAILAIQKTSEIFDNYSFDLIYARPNQNLNHWEKELHQAMKLTANHISLYQLTIEKGTEFFAQYRDKKFTLPNENVASEMYELTDNILGERGFEKYEISNYAKPNFESQHNLAYWQYDEYIGIGAGAHSRVSLPPNSRNAIVMESNPQKWYDKAIVKNAGIQRNDKVSGQDLASEILLMGLRLKEGISLKKFEQITSKNLGEMINHTGFEKMSELNLIELKNDHLRTTEGGMFVLGSVLSELIL